MGEVGGAWNVWHQYKYKGCGFFFLDHESEGPGYRRVQSREGPLDARFRKVNLEMGCVLGDTGPCQMFSSIPTRRLPVPHEHPGQSGFPVPAAYLCSHCQAQPDAERAGVLHTFDVEGGASAEPTLLSAGAFRGGIATASG